MTLALQAIGMTKLAGNGNQMAQLEGFVGKLPMKVELQKSIKLVRQLIAEGWGKAKALGETSGWL